MATLDRLNPAPGTCVALTESPRLWLVRGSAGWYRCDADRQTCSCADFLYRRTKSHTACKHLRALTEYLMIAAAARAEVLEPEPEFAPRSRYVIEEEPAPLPSDEELRRMFA